ncbi:thioesterase II family protein [Staphylococcus massiliensis]|uniref:thioesterase II family protein n=1 Tax=Staphylococcus massiliensis TaxID=555791 RepID=UPI00370D6858
MSKRQLICLPYAGGSASIYNDLKAHVQDDIELKTIELPGKGSRFTESPLISIEDMVNEVVAQIKDLNVGDYDILGYSLGTILAYETYFKLKEAGMTLPKRLFLAASEPIGYRGEPEGVKDMDQDAFKTFIKDKGGTPEAVLENDELWQLVSPSLRADFEAIDAYSDKPHDDEIDLDAVIMSGEDDIDSETLSKWEAYFSGKVTIEYFDGGHFFLHNEPKAIAEVIHQHALS